MEQLPDYPIARSSPFVSPDIYEKMRLEGPAAKVRMWDGSTAWVVTRATDVRTVLLNNKSFSASPHTPGYPMLSATWKALITSDTLMPKTEGDLHARWRRVLAQELTVKRVEALRERVRGYVIKLIDEMIAEGGTIDLVAKFALQVPMMTIAGLLGVPYEDHAFFEENSNLRVMLDVDPQVPLRATRDLADYFNRLLLDRAANPTEADDILSRLARIHVANGAITHDEAVILAYTLVQGGHETTANMIALGTLLLLQNPVQLRALLEDPALVRGAVEEMLRCATIIQYSVARVAIEDVEVGGTLIRKGEGLFAMLFAANYDPDVFPKPDEFSISRPGRNHVAFGFGVHQCMGQQLARLELQEVFSLLFQRLPNLHLAVPFEQLEFKTRNANFGLHALPVTW